MTNDQVLLVEPTQMWSDIVVESIQENTTLTLENITIVNSYEEALQKLKQNTSSLVITDISLPKGFINMRGFDIIQRSYDLKIPVIAITGLEDSNVFKQAMKDLTNHQLEGVFHKTDSNFKKDLAQKIKEVLQSSPKKFTHHQDSPSQNAPCYHAILIGIANYKYVSQLSKTTNDAKDLREVLANNGYLPENVALLTDENATKANISKELNRLAQGTNPNDTVVLFFSGHGLRLAGGFSPGEYLCPVEADLNQVNGSCISSIELTNALRAIRAKRLVVFLDSCHSGGVGQPKELGVQVQPGLSTKLYKDLAEREGRVIIASCKSEEVSWELPGMSNGLFTHYLLKGLRGEDDVAKPDGTVSILSLFDYVSDRVSKHKSQHPLFKAETENFPIAYTKGFTSGPSSVANSSQPKPSQLQREQIFISYSHQNVKWLKKFKTMLQPAIKQQKISIWDDKMIQTGANWRDDIQKALASAKVALLLVSADFLASDFIVEQELPPLLEAAEKEGVKIFWVYLSPCMYELTEIEKYQAAHDISRPLDDFSPSERNLIIKEICTKLLTTAKIA